MKQSPFFIDKILLLTTIVNIIMKRYFPTVQLRSLHKSVLRRLLHHRFWQYPRGSHVNDDNVDELRIFAMFIYHSYINPANYRTTQVLCGELFTEATNLLEQESRDHPANVTSLIHYRVPTLCLRWNPQQDRFFPAGNGGSLRSPQRFAHSISAQCYYPLQ